MEARVNTSIHFTARIDAALHQEGPIAANNGDPAEGYDLAPILVLAPLELFFIRTPMAWVLSEVFAERVTPLAGADAPRAPA